MARILIVDDEWNIRNILNSVLQAEGHSCVLATDTSEARQALAGQPFELVTLDIGLSDESGLDFIKVIRNDHPDTAVVMVTVIGSPETARQAVENGAFGYIRKPFEREDLIINVDNALRRRDLEIAGRSYRTGLEEEVRKRTRELSRSEERFRRLVEKMTEGLAATDPETRLTYVNRRFCELLGFDEAELLGRPMGDFVDPGNLEHFKSQIAQRPQGIEDRYELIWRTRTGAKLYTMVSPSALFDDAGKFVGGFGVVTDITAIKRAEHALKNDLAVNTSLAETARELVSSAGLDEIAQKILQKAEKLTESRFGFVGYIDPATGYLMAPTLSTMIWEECRVDNREAVFDKFSGLWEWVLKNNKPILVNEVSKDGRFSGTPTGHVPIDRFLGVPARLGDRLVGMIGLANANRDYTEEDLRLVQPYSDLFAAALERKLYEDEIKSREQYLRIVLDSIAAGIMIIDRETHVIKEVNPTAAALIGSPKEEIMGRECWNYVCPTVEHCCPVTDKQTKIENSERKLINASGKEIPIIKTVVPLTIGGVPHLLETFVDITQQKQMEFKLAQAQKLEAIGQLAAGIAHEINTPMQFIQGNIEFLEEATGALTRIIDECAAIARNAASDTPSHEIIRTMRIEVDEHNLDFYNKEIPEAVAGCLNGVERIRRIVDSMRYFAHPGQMGKSPMDINQAVENALTISRNQWKYCAVVKTDLDPDLPAINGLQAELNQVLLNLIINAAQAVAEVHGEKQEPDGVIRVATRRIPDGIELRIGDNGPGIPSEYGDRIFEPFFTTKAVGQGTGQGLAISYNIIVEKHGGTIDFETELGVGTTFIIRLPLNTEQGD